MPIVVEAFPTSGVAVANFVNPGNITADDNTFASVAAASGATEAVEGRNFGFSIPSYAEITGVEIEHEVKYSGDGQGEYLAKIELFVSGVSKGSGTTTDTQTSPTLYTYNITGLTAWSPSDMANGTLTVRSSVTRNSPSFFPVSYFVDYIKVRITYRLLRGSSTITLGASARGLDPKAISGLIQWSKADAIFQADNTALASWPDLSTANNPFEQATGGNQPTYRTNVVNGKPVVRFNGTSSKMLLQNNATIGGNYTIFVVTKTNANRQQNFIDGDGGSNRVFQFRYSADNNIQHIGFNTGGSPFTDSGPSFTGSNFNIMEAVRRMSDVEAYVNGATNGLTASTGTNQSLSRKLTMGVYNVSEAYLDGDIAEVLYYNSALTNAQRRTIEEGLAAAYGIGIVKYLSASATLTTTAAAKMTVKLVGSAAVAFTAGAVMHPTRRVIGTAAIAVASVTPNIKLASRLLATSAIAVSAAGLMHSSKPLLGTAAVVTTAGGVERNTKPLLSAVAVVTTAGGVERTTKPLIGSSALVVSVAGAMHSAKPLIGSAAVVTTAAGVGRTAKPLIGAATITTTGAGVERNTKPLHGAVTTLFPVSANAHVTFDMSGRSDLVFSVSAPSGALRVAHSLVGSGSVSIGSSRAVLSGAKKLIGSSAVTFADTGVLHFSAALSGRSDVTTSASGLVRRAVPIVGHGDLVTSAAASVRLAAALSSHPAIAFSASGTWHVAMPLVSSAAVVTTSSASIVRVQRNLAASAATIFAASGFARIGKGLQATSSVAFTAQGHPIVAYRLAGSSQVLFSAGGFTRIAKRFTGSASTLQLVAGGQLSPVRGLQGAGALAVNAASHLSAQTALSGHSDLLFDGVGRLGVAGQIYLQGQSSLQFAVSRAYLHASFALAGQSNLVFTGVGTAGVVRGLRSTVMSFIYVNGTAHLNLGLLGHSDLVLTAEALSALRVLRRLGGLSAVTTAAGGVLHADKRLQGALSVTIDAAGLVRVLRHLTGQSTLTITDALAILTVLTGGRAAAFYRTDGVGASGLDATSTGQGSMAHLVISTGSFSAETEEPNADGSMAHALVGGGSMRMREGG